MQQQIVETVNLILIAVDISHHPVYSEVEDSFPEYLGKY